MNKIPIPFNQHTLNDPNYRYKRDKICLKPNGQFDIIDNLNQIAKQLNVNPSILVNHLKSTSAQSFKQFVSKNITKYAIKTNSKTAEEIDNMLELFILSHLICPRCKLPEISTSDFESCNACGYDKSNTNNETNDETNNETNNDLDDLDDLDDLNNLDEFN